MITNAELIDFEKDKFFFQKIVIHDLDTILGYNEYDTVILIYS